MDLRTGDLRAHLIAALVPGDDLHLSRLTDDHDPRPERLEAHVFQQNRHAEAAGLLVERKGDMDRPLKVQRLEVRHRAQDAGEKTLHVDRAAPVEPAVPARQREWIGGPILPLDGNHVGVPVEHDTAIDFRPQRREQIGALRHRRHS